MYNLTLIQLITISSFLLIEATVNFIYNLDVYKRKDTFTAICIGAMSVSLIFATKNFFLGTLMVVYQYRIFHFNNGWFVWVVLVIVCDLFYYMTHYMDHKVKFFWASHAIHHSSEKFNLTTNFRMPVALVSFRMLYWTPMVLLGFRPEMIVISDTIIEFYTTFLHTKVIKKMGLLERIFNTPSHHRVHHSSNKEYIDKNFGGMLIIWDRMFGTFISEKEEPRYGVIGLENENNPIKIIFYGWKPIISDILCSSSTGEVFKSIFGKPGVPILKKVKTSPNRNLQHRSLLKSNRIKIYASIIIGCLLLFVIKVKAQSQGLTYRIMKGDGYVGLLYVDRKQNEGRIVYTAESDVKVNMLLTYNIYIKITEEYRENHLLQSSYLRKVNGDEKLWTSTYWNGNTFVMNLKKGDAKKNKNSIAISSINIYYCEPLTDSVFYSESLLVSSPIRKLCLHHYLVTFPGGDKTYFTYVNGICTYIEDHNFWAVVKYYLESPPEYTTTSSPNQSWFSNYDEK